MAHAADYALAQLDEIDELDDGRCPFRPVRHQLGITTFGAIAMTAHADGDRVINEHSEDDQDSSEELYVVLRGHATFELDGERRDAPSGTFVRVAPGVKRTAFAREAGTTVLAIGAGPPGQPYQPTGWELFAPLFALYRSGDYAQAAQRANQLLADIPPSGGAYYNTACFEALAGRTADALVHLRRAVELMPSLAELARSDDDLVSLRQEPAYAEIVGG